MAQSAKNDFSQGSMSRNIMNIALPMILAQLINVLYSVVDRMYIGRLPDASTLALTGIGLTLPVTSMITAFSNLFSTGGAPLFSIARGEGNEKKASRILGTSASMLILMGLLLTILVWAVKKPMLYLLGASDATFPYANEYLTIYLLGTIFVMISLGLNSFINAQGFARTGMFTVLIGAILNIILDPILIFGLIGFPRMGIQGAAAATVFGQIVAMLLALMFNATKNHDVTIRFRGFTPSGHTIRLIYAVGVPSIIMQSIGSVMTFGMNKILIAFSETAVAVFGVYFKLQSFIFMPIFGLNNGMIPIVAYNYGARSKKRIMATVRMSIYIAVGIMLIGLVVFQLFTRDLLMMFQADENMLAIGVPALRIISLSFLFAGYCIIVGSVFQALGHGV